MRILPSLATLLILASPSWAGAALPRDLPIRYAGQPSSIGRGPAWSGDVIEIRLAPAAARQARPAGAGRTAGLGLAGVDRVARELGGATFEPEFRGEHAPAEGSGEIDFTAFQLVHLPPGVGLEQALERFAAQPEVVAVSPIAILPMSAIPNDSLWSVSTWFFQPSRRDLHAPEAWDITTGDPAVVVAILDSGVLPYHPDIGGTIAGDPGRIWTNVAERDGAPNVDDDDHGNGNGFVDDVHGWDFVTLGGPGLVEPGEDWESPDPDPNDFAGHGTACAGIVGALTDNGIGIAGTAWNVRIMPLRVAYAFPGADLGEAEPRMDWVAQAIRYATRNGAQVINCSFETENTDGLDAAVTAAVRAGVTVVNAAGNFQRPYIYLGSRDDVIAVAATNASDVIAPFSSTGPYIELAAPGTGIATTWLAPHTAPPTDSIGIRQGAYSARSGTSYAAPLVAGAVALLQSRQRELGKDPLHPMAVLLRLDETADDIAALNPGSLGYGSGRLNLQRALTETSGSTAIRTGGAARGAPAVIHRPPGFASIYLATDDRRIVGIDRYSMDTAFVATLAGVPTGVLAVAGGDGVLPAGIFTGASNGAVYGFDWDGQPLPNWPVGSGSPKWGGPAVGDVDGDLADDVVIGADNGSVYAWRTNGTPIPGLPAPAVSGRIRAPVALAQLDGSPGLEIVVAGENGDLTALDGAGVPVPGWEAIALGDVPLAPVVAVLGRVGPQAVVVAAGSTLHAFTSDGAPAPGFPVTLGAPVFVGLDPAIGDLDLDGSEDIVIVTSAGIEARDSAGVSLAGFPRPLAGIQPGSPVIGQLQAGAAPEIMLPTLSGLAAFDATGDPLPRFPRPGSGGAHPTLDDLDDDGWTAEVLSGALDSLFCLYIYDAGPGSYDPAPHPWPTARGNFQRSGQSRRAIPVAVLDTESPAMVLDLAATRVDPQRVMLRWTAPGDDGVHGRALVYDVRRAARPIAPSEFAGLEAVPVGFPPAVAGARESLLVELPEGEAAWYALVTTDEVGNRGPMSNLAAIGAPAAPSAIALAVRRNPARPPAIFDWRAPAGGGPAPELLVHDALGRLVSRIPLPGGGAGATEWDGRDLDGRAVSAGLYFVRLSAAGSAARTRLVLLP